ncbi:MAG: transposase [Gammaproteobacteria bacterium]|nr:transposase [Gammaproteobacteria bacterium]
MINHHKHIRLLSDHDHQQLYQRPVFLQSIFQSDQPLSAKKQQGFPIKFIPKRLASCILSEDKLDSKKYEFMVYSQLCEALNQGKVHCYQSKKFRCLSDDIRSVIEWDNEKARKKLIKSLDIEELSQPISDILDALEQELNHLIEQVNQNIQSGKNRCIKYKKNSTGYEWTLPYNKKYREFNNPFYNSIPHISLSELLDFVEEITHFMSAFEPLKSRGIRSTKNKLALKGCIIANATGLGIHKMSERSDLSYQQLDGAESDYLRLETLKKANDKIVYAFTQLAIFQHYNVADNIYHASADGQKFRSRKDTFKSRYSSKYFACEKGVVSYTSVMNNIAPATQMMGANEHESHYLQELISASASTVAIDRIATDSHGSNAINFLLLNCMRIAFTPCYKRLSKKTESIVSFNHPNTYCQDKYIIRPGKKANRLLIEKEWENIKPLIAALMVKEFDQNIIVKKLCAKEKNNPTKQALWAYNDILRSIYLLKYIDDEILRQNVRLSLNRGEAYHQLKRRLLDVNGQGFRGQSDVEIAIWNECGRSVANAIIYYNAYLLSKLMQQKEAEGDDKAVKFIRRLSPIACQHINMGGAYELTNGENMPDIDTLLKVLDQLLITELSK